MNEVGAPFHEVDGEGDGTLEPRRLGAPGISLLVLGSVLAAALVAVTVVEAVHMRAERSKCSGYLLRI